MKVSVVIPTYNRPGLALGLSRQIRAYHPQAEIIVVDQSQKKEPSKEIKKLGLIYLDDNKINTSVAKNVGFSRATGDIVIFFDDDVEITPQTIKAHLKEYRHRSVLGVAGRVINDGETVPAETSVTTGWVNRSLTNFIGNFWGTKSQKVLFPYGCNMSFRRRTLKHLGCFDKKITPPGFEEYDLGLRVSRVGQMRFSPEALVYHHRAVSGGNRLSRGDWYRKYYWNYGRMVAKHVPFFLWPYSLARLSLRIIKEYSSALGGFYTGFFAGLFA